MTETIDGLQRVIAALRMELEDIDFRIDELQEEKDPIEAEIAKLEKEIEELEDAELEDAD